MQQLEDNPLVEVALRARSGDAGATDVFRREMRVALEGMVRLALRKRISFSPFDDYARAQAGRLQESSDWQLPDAELARQTAERVCREMIDRLQAGGRVQDTLACSSAGGGASKYQTVVSSQKLELPR